MSKLKWSDRARKFIGRIAWRVFLWSLGKTDAEYWEEVLVLEEAYVKGLQSGVELRGRLDALDAKARR